MNEYKIKKQQWHYLGYNLVAFTIIFALFASIIYVQLSHSLFSRIDDDLYHAKEKILSKEDYADEQINMSDNDSRAFADRNNQEPREPSGATPEGAENAQPPDESGSKKLESFVGIPMRMQVVVRDQNGEVLNGHVLGRLFWENTLSTLPFSSDDLDSIVNFQLEDGSYFRSLSFRHQNLAGETCYIQILSTSDGEHGVISSFTNILVVCVMVFILLSFTASYLLSKKNMAPVLRAWERQTEFVENASHELRTPLTIIQNKLEALLTTPQATILDKADNIAVSLSETRRLSKLTGDLMTLARADSSEPILQKESFPLDQMIQKMTGPYCELAEMQKKNMALDLQYGGNLNADKSRIHELLVILLDNALKYTKEGDEIRITTLQKEGKAVIRVVDTGIGIKEESLSRVFDRFYREDKARSREHGGTGLGLSIAVWIVGSHDGVIKAERNNPRGTVLEVRLPK